MLIKVLAFLLLGALCSASNCPAYDTCTDTATANLTSPSSLIASRRAFNLLHLLQRLVCGVNTDPTCDLVTLDVESDDPIYLATSGRLAKFAFSSRKQDVLSPDDGPDTIARLMQTLDELFSVPDGHTTSSTPFRHTSRWTETVDALHSVIALLGLDCYHDLSECPDALSSPPNPHQHEGMAFRIPTFNPNSPGSYLVNRTELNNLRGALQILTSIMNQRADSLYNEGMMHFQAHYDMFQTILWGILGYEAIPSMLVEGAFIPVTNISYPSVNGSTISDALWRIARQEGESSTREQLTGEAITSLSLVMTSIFQHLMGHANNEHTIPQLTHAQSILGLMNETLNGEYQFHHQFPIHYPRFISTMGSFVSSYLDSIQTSTTCSPDQPCSNQPTTPVASTQGRVPHESLAELENRLTQMETIIQGAVLGSYNDTPVQTVIHATIDYLRVLTNLLDQELGFPLSHIMKNHIDPDVFFNPFPHHHYNITLDPSLGIHENYNRFYQVVMNGSYEPTRATPMSMTVNSLVLSYRELANRTMSPETYVTHVQASEMVAGFRSEVEQRLNTATTTIGSTLRIMDDGIQRRVMANNAKFGEISSNFTKTDEELERITTRVTTLEETAANPTGSSQDGSVYSTCPCLIDNSESIFLMLIRGFFGIGSHSIVKRSNTQTNSSSNLLPQGHQDVFVWQNITVPTVGGLYKNLRRMVNISRETGKLKESIDEIEWQKWILTAGVVTSLFLTMITIIRSIQDIILNAAKINQMKKQTVKRAGRLLNLAAKPIVSIRPMSSIYYERDHEGISDCRRKLMPNYGGQDQGTQTLQVMVTYRHSSHSKTLPIGEGLAYERFSEGFTFAVQIATIICDRSTLGEILSRDPFVTRTEWGACEKRGFDEFILHSFVGGPEECFMTRLLKLGNCLAWLNDYLLRKGSLGKLVPANYNHYTLSHDCRHFGPDAKVSPMLIQLYLGHTRLAQFELPDLYIKYPVTMTITPNMQMMEESHKSVHHDFNPTCPDCRAFSSLMPMMKQIDKNVKDVLTKTENGQKLIDRLIIAANEASRASGTMGPQFINTDMINGAQSYTKDAGRDMSFDQKMLIERTLLKLQEGQGRLIKMLLGFLGKDGLAALLEAQRFTDKPYSMDSPDSETSTHTAPGKFISLRGTGYNGAFELEVLKTTRVRSGPSTRAEETLIFNAS